MIMEDEFNKELPNEIIKVLIYKVFGLYGIKESLMD